MSWLETFRRYAEWDVNHPDASDEDRRLVEYLISRPPLDQPFRRPPTERYQPTREDEDR